MNRNFPTLTKTSFVSSIAIILVLFAIVLALSLKTNAVPEPAQDLANVPLIPSAVQTVRETVVATVQASPSLPSPTIQPVPFTTAVGAQDPEVGRGDFGSWSYSAVRKSTGLIVAGVRYDSSSISALGIYAVANRALANQLVTGGGEVDVYITFRNYVEPSQFRSWARTMGLNVQRSEMRYVTQGTLGSLDATLGMGGIPSDPLPEAAFTNRFQEISARPEFLAFRGVYFTVATISASRLPQLATDPLVFLADVTPNAVRKDLVAHGVPGAAEALIGVASTSTGYNPTPFWQMEHDYGLENFQITVTPTVPVPTVLVPTIPIPTIVVPVP